MYIIACRAHFCHLLGLSQVGHSPRETSGSDGTLEQGPLPGLGEVGHSPRGTSGSAGDPGLGPNVVRLPVHLPSPMHPYTPYVSIPQLTPECLHSLPALNAPLISLNNPPIPWCSLTPLGAPDAMYTPASPWVPTLPASPPPMHPWHPAPLMAPSPWWPLHPWFPFTCLGAPWCHLYPCWLLGTYTPFQLPNAPLTPPTPPDGPLIPLHP